METTNYHNTNKLTSKRLIEATSKAITQQQIVLKIFKHHKQLTASEVYKKFLKYTKTTPPITSIRRAISNLQSQKKILKTQNTVLGMYNSPEHYYKLIN